MSDGFLGYKASLMLDVVACALVVVVPTLLVSLYAVKIRRNYRLHKTLQIALGLVLLRALCGGWNRAEMVDWDDERLVRAALIFKTIVRLKGGDHMIFAHAGEELDCLVQHQIEFEIVPGVTAAVAAASYAGLPLTQRDAASAVALVTGQENEAKAAATLDYAALARFPGTLVFYMGVTTAGHWSEALLAAGKPPTTPVAILRHVSLPDQQRIDTTLSDVAAIIAELKLRPPVIFVVGEVAASEAAWTWFEKRPLFGKRMLVTRPAHQADDLVRPLAELGAEVLLQQAIEIKPVADFSAVDRSLELLDRFDWLVFSSSNGVRYFLDRLPKIGHDVRLLGKVKIAAIGPGTAEELSRYQLTADLIPDEFRADSLAKSLAGSASSSTRVLLSEGMAANSKLSRLFTAGNLASLIRRSTVRRSRSIISSSARRIR
jgi:uroporphyrinogen III methyltransferase/synthase